MHGLRFDPWWITTHVTPSCLIWTTDSASVSFDPGTGICPLK